MFSSKFLAAGIAALFAAMPASGVATPDTAPAERCGGTSPQVVHDWQRTILRTVYTEGANPVPVGVPYLGFTSLAIVKAVARACERADSSPVAAVAVAGHDVLVEYFPGSRDSLDDDLAASLEDVPDGPAKNRGIADGARAAARMIASREDDGRDDSSIVYDREPAPGVWQPEEGASMLAPWLGFVDPLVLRHPIRSNGPDALTSRAYALDTRRCGRSGPPPARTAPTTRPRLPGSSPRTMRSCSATPCFDTSTLIRSTSRRRPDFSPRSTPR